MTPRPTRLGRALLGYRPSHVRQFLLERDALISQAEKQIQSAQAKEAEVQAELAALRSELASRERDLAAFAEAAKAPANGSASELSVEYLREEAYRIMEAAEETTRRIIQRGRESLDRQLEELIRTRTEIAAEIEDLMTWQDAAGALRGLTEDTRILIREVPGRLRDALVPLDSAVIKLDETLDQVSDLPKPRRPADAPVDPNGSAESGPIVTMDDDGSTVSYTPTGAVPPPMPVGYPPPRAI